MPVWDPLVRLFHWSLVVAVGIDLFLEDGTDLHDAAGYVVLGLVAFRLIWGFVGPRHARFADFVRGPGAVLSYLGDLARRRARPYLGHNPAGGAMIVLLLADLALASGSGALLGTDAFRRVEWVETVHAISGNLLFILVPLHLLGVLVGSIADSENLLAAMLTGRKRAPRE